MNAWALLDRIFAGPRVALSIDELSRLMVAAQEHYMRDARGAQTVLYYELEKRGPRVVAVFKDGEREVVCTWGVF